jgi:ABC-type dipeptide/oligopeptide/nickel transport system ATPase subunit
MMSLLSARSVRLCYQKGRDRRPALNDVTVEIYPGECLGIIGESGSGKSSLARVLTGLQRPDAGEVRLDGEQIFVSHGFRRGSAHFARSVQFVVQDSAGALNPRMRNWESATEAVRLLNGAADPDVRREQARTLFDRVGLDEDLLDRLPHALSGGQRQRLALCRALAVSPRLIILDEPTSALDLSVQAGILDELLTLNLSGVALAIISHDLGVIRHLSTRVVVMRDGAILEEGSAEGIVASPKHTYTRELVEAGLAGAPALREATGAG